MMKSRDTIQEEEGSRGPLLDKQRSGILAGNSGAGDEVGGSCSVTGILVLSTFVAVCGSYVFGSAVSFLSVV